MIMINTPEGPYTGMHIKESAGVTKVKVWKGGAEAAARGDLPVLDMVDSEEFIGLVAGLHKKSEGADAKKN